MIYYIISIEHDLFNLWGSKTAFFLLDMIKGGFYFVLCYTKQVLINKQYKLDNLCKREFVGKIFGAERCPKTLN